MKSENLNYNSQIFTLTSLFLHSTSSNINVSSITAAVLFLRSDPDCWSVAAPPQMLDHSHAVNLRNFSPLSSSDFCFFVFAGLALCPLRFMMNCIDCISVFVNCGLLAFIGLVWLLVCVMSCVDRRLSWCL